MKFHTAPQSIWENPLQFIAFGFGSGAMPIAPGTFGTLAAIPLYLLIQHLPLWSYIIVLILAIVIGFWICDVAEKAIGVTDHPGIVWDEIVGYGVTMFAAPKGWGWIIFGFILFRIFDIWKPQPIRWVDAHLKGGVGIVVDDILAAIPAWIILHIIAWISS
jgi:phosphatidylglycerophosphatase A